MTTETAQIVAQKIANFGLSQAQAAELIGIAQPTFGRVLKGESDTTATIFLKMKAVLSELQESSSTKEVEA